MAYMEHLVQDDTLINSNDFYPNALQGGELRKDDFLSPASSIAY